MPEDDNQKFVLKNDKLYSQDGNYSYQSFIFLSLPVLRLLTVRRSSINQICQNPP